MRIKSRTTAQILKDGVWDAGAVIVGVPLALAFVVAVLGGMFFEGNQTRLCGVCKTWRGVRPVKIPVSGGLVRPPWSTCVTVYRCGRHVDGGE